ncbi:MAG: agmatine deiminase family protein [Dysgonamonadaceae bacterium]|jgi:agmatine/peptidylarginine deiminase|nr:agmatine deiminase family protein [Dysgonamonadaceae bacterium]
MKKHPNILFPAEWYPQGAILLTWPHAHTDWQPLLPEVIPCYVRIAQEILRREKLMIVCASIPEVTAALGASANDTRILFREIPSNDTWARDHGPVSVYIQGRPAVLDFGFNGWGLKFPAHLDNQITRRLYQSGVFDPAVEYCSFREIVLEGGSLESDGQGTILTTARCLLSPNRNEYGDTAEAEEYLKILLGARQVLWLHHGDLAGDDTDSHIDTLARFCDPETIAYVRCTDENDEHFAELSRMEKELQSFRTAKGKPYRLLPLPMAEAVYDAGERLPATYANFLIINGAVLMPTYRSPLDEQAKAALQTAFPGREIVGVDCLPLIKQHGSLHCVTMQIPHEFIAK